MCGHSLAKSSPKHHKFLLTYSEKLGNLAFPDSSLGTIATWLTPQGGVVGIYVDANGLDHGYLRVP
jgi:hypothetical protein